jgi:hypothetical protein
MKATLLMALMLSSVNSALAQPPSNQQASTSSCNPQDIMGRQSERLKVLVQARSLFAEAYRKFVFKREQLDSLKDEVARRGKVSIFFRSLKNPLYRTSEIQRLERELERDIRALKDADVLIQIESQDTNFEYERDKLRCLVENAPNN